MLSYDLTLLASLVTFLFSLLFLSLIAYLHHFFGESQFGKSLRVLSAGALFFAASAALSLIGVVSRASDGGYDQSSKALLVLFLITAAYSISLFKSSFERVEWLREQWIKELKEHHMEREEPRR